MPTDPKMWKRLGHPMARIIWGEADSPKMEPRNMPEYTRARERLRSFTGTHLGEGGVWWESQRMSRPQCGYKGKWESWR